MVARQGRRLGGCDRPEKGKINGQRSGRNRAHASGGDEGTWTPRCQGSPAAGECRLPDHALCPFRRALIDRGAGAGMFDHVGAQEPRTAALRQQRAPANLAACFPAACPRQERRTRMTPRCWWSRTPPANPAGQRVHAGCVPKASWQHWPYPCCWMEGTWPCVFYSPVAEVFDHGVALGAAHHASRIRNEQLLAFRRPAGNPSTPGELHRALASRSDIDLAVGQLPGRSILRYRRHWQHSSVPRHTATVNCTPWPTTTCRMRSRLPQAEQVRVLGAQELGACAVAAQQC